MQPSNQLVDKPKTTLGSNNNINDNCNTSLNFDHFENAEKTSLDLKLNKWIIEYHVSHNYVNALLAILISEGQVSPKLLEFYLKH